MSLLYATETTDEEKRVKNNVFECNSFRRQRRKDCFRGFHSKLGMYDGNYSHTNLNGNFD